MSELTDEAPVIVSESIVLSKFEESEDQESILVEKVYVENGEITKHEFFDENGEVTRTVERGDE